jgi:hypothetical protein
VRVDEVLALREHFPEAPEWVTERDWSLADARNAMVKLRLREAESTGLAFRERGRATELLRILKHGG